MLYTLQERCAQAVVALDAAVKADYHYRDAALTLLKRHQELEAAEKEYAKASQERQTANTIVQRLSVGEKLEDTALILLNIKKT